MAVKTSSELLDSIKGILGDNTSDEAIALLEDVSDTLKANEKPSDGVNWQEKYEQNDAAWREKYRNRFFNSPADEGDDEPDDTDLPKDEPQKELTTYEELFKESD